MLRIWGRLSSINARKVVLTAQWLDLTFTRLDAGREFGVVDTPEFRAKNPNGLIPLLSDGAFELWESNVIVRYLCAKHSLGALYPESLERRFDAERWMDWQQTTFNPAGRDAFVQLIRTPPEQRQASLVARSVRATEPLLAQLDAHLARQPFMAGSAPTMADIPLACELHRWRRLPIEHGTLPHLDRWYRSIAARPAARGVLDLPLS